VIEILTRINDDATRKKTLVEKQKMDPLQAPKLSSHSTHGSSELTLNPS